MRSKSYRRSVLSQVSVLLMGALAVAIWMAGCGPEAGSGKSALPAARPASDRVAPLALDEIAVNDPYEAHAKLFLSDRFPSAFDCGQCHPTQFRQWSVSQHAYAQLSPIFNSMQAQIDKGTNGTNGDFCIRCHTQIGMILGEKEFMSNIDRHPISREGITCVTCHRIEEQLGKISGRFPLTEGALNDTVYGPTGRNTELNKAIAAEGLVTDKSAAGRHVHGKTQRFFRITTSAFCGSCHDVTLFNGFRLEEAFSEYKHSPAAARGVLCQDCHMGKEQGRILADRNDPNFDRLNYAFGPAAKVGDFETAPRKLANHMFVGPDFSVIHPALFPHHVGAVKDEKQKDDPAAPGLATIREWMTFDWKAGWGTDAFEKHVPPDQKFPARWSSADDRYDARMIVDDNMKLLAEAAQARLTLLRTGYKLGDIVTRKSGPDGIEFAVQFKNGMDGHGVPTGFDAERLVWLHVTVKDADGRVIHESGDLDPNGDVRDRRSTFVRNQQLPLDEELFSLQGEFIVRLERGGEREQVLTTNFSPSPLPFLRPERMSSILQGRPNAARKQKNNIEPLGERWASYHISPRELTGRAPYTVDVQIKSAMVPVNLVNEVQGVGFDYGMTTKMIRDNLVAGHIIVAERQATLAR